MESVLLFTISFVIIDLYEHEMTTRITCDDNGYVVPITANTLDKTVVSHFLTAWRIVLLFIISFVIIDPYEKIDDNFY